MLFFKGVKPPEAIPNPSLLPRTNAEAEIEIAKGALMGALEACALDQRRFEADPTYIAPGWHTMAVQTHSRTLTRHGIDPQDPNLYC